MSKSRQKGFSNTPKKQFSKSKKTHIPTAQTTKEQPALQLINQGKLNEAELIYRELAAASQNPTVHGNLGALLKMRGDTKNAITCFRKALQLKPNYPEAHYNLGNALQEQGDLTAAIDSYNSALQLKPDFPEALLGTLCVIEDARGLEDLKAKVRRAADFDRNILNKPQYVELTASLGGKFMRDILSSKLSAY